MAKNKKVSVKQNADIEKSDEVLTAVSKKSLKKERKADIAKKAEIKNKKKMKVSDKPKKRPVKETLSELKKVSWPTFKKACKQTGTVLAVVAVFMLVVFGLDEFIKWIIKLIVNI